MKINRSEVVRSIANSVSTFPAKLAGGAALALGSIASAHADLPAAIGTQLAQVQSDGLDLANLVWPVVITLFGALILFKLFKRFGSQI